VRGNQVVAGQEAGAAVNPATRKQAGRTGQPAQEAPERVSAGKGARAVETAARGAVWAKCARNGNPAQTRSALFCRQGQDAGVCAVVVCAIVNAAM